MSRVPRCGHLGRGVSFTCAHGRGWMGSGRGVTKRPSACTLVPADMLPTLRKGVLAGPWGQGLAVRGYADPGVCSRVSLLVACAWGTVRCLPLFEL